MLDKKKRNALIVGAAVGVGLAALRQEQADDAATLAPNYLRLSQAERERNEKLQNN